MSFGGFLGLGHSHYPIPWAVLKYDTALGGYRTGVTEQQLKDAPSVMTAGRIEIGKPALTNVMEYRNIGTKEQEFSEARFYTFKGRFAPSPEVQRAAGWALALNP